MNRSQQEQILNQWMSSHRGLLFKVVRAFASTLHDQDDLFQQIIMQLWRSIPRYTDEVAVTTWVYRVAFYTASSWKRGENRRKRRTHLLGDADSVLTQRAESTDPRLEWLFGQIARLPDVDRSLALMMLDGFSYREMSEVMGITESNVGVRINRIRKRLSQKLPGDPIDEL